jgi:two-component system chemotaxis response regulator CheY
MLVGRILKELGFEVIDASNGKEGLAKLAAGDIADVALVDWNMPEMNGLEFVQAVRAVSTYSSMRIIMITSETEAGNVQAALESGADEYVMKPFTKDVLADKFSLIGIGPKVES